MNNGHGMAQAGLWPEDKMAATHWCGSYFTISAWRQNPGYEAARTFSSASAIDRTNCV